MVQKMTAGEAAVRLRELLSDAPGARGVSRAAMLLASSGATEDELLALEHAAAGARMRLVQRRCPEIESFARIAAPCRWRTGNIVRVMSGEDSQGRVRVDWDPEDNCARGVRPESWAQPVEELAPMD